jgi:hypothetical protein
VVAVASLNVAVVVLAVTQRNGSGLQRQNLLDLVSRLDQASGTLLRDHLRAEEHAF